MRRLHNSNVPGKQVKISGTTTLPKVDFLGKNIYVLTTAVTSGVTAPPAGSATGDLAVTTNATGRDKWFYSDGTHLVAMGDGNVTPAAHVASVSTANATDLPTAVALSNANKVAINAILTALQGAGLMS